MNLWGALGDGNVYGNSTFWELRVEIPWLRCQETYQEKSFGLRKQDDTKVRLEAFPDAWADPKSRSPVRFCNLRHRSFGASNKPEQLLVMYFRPQSSSISSLGFMAI